MAVPGPLIGGSPGRRQPDILEEFDGRLGVATGLLEADDRETLEDRVALTTELMVSERMVDPDTEVEIRPLVPDDKFWAGGLSRNYLEASEVLIDRLDSAYDIHAVPYEKPIAPAASDEAPVSSQSVWSTLGSELSHFKRYNQRPERHLAMLAIAEKPYIQRILGDQALFDVGNLPRSPLAVMYQTAEEPRANILLPAQTPKLLDQTVRSSPEDRPAN